MARTAVDLRRAELATIHVARVQLGMSEDHYRDVMHQVTGKRSAADLDWTGRKKLIDHFRKLGFAPKRKATTGLERQLWHIRKLWAELAASGAVRDGGEKALEAHVKRQTGVDRVEWIDPGQASAVIEGLKSWRARAVKSPG